jgi:hypothetical protein
MNALLHEVVTDMKKSYLNVSTAIALLIGAAGIASTQVLAQERPDGPRQTGGGRDGDAEGERGGRPPQGSTTRSPQGLNEDADRRRDDVVNRPGRGEFDENRRGGREVRTYDGTNNNRDNPTWGATFSHLQRIAPANYVDGVASMAGTDLKSAREISNLLVAQADGESIPNTYNTSDYLWQWGQFIDHDIGLTDGSTPEQENIIVPQGDVFFDPNGTGDSVIPFNRAIYDPDTGLSEDNVREQENEISSWIDGSMIYGSDDERNASLRVGPDSPFLATSEGDLLPFNQEALANANGFIPDPSLLFLAGDVRANEQAGLTAMHTIWVREHNRIATLLQERRPEASVEEIYEQARRLVIAEIQIITYDEYLPALLGADTMPEYEGYDPTVNPSIYNEFSAAAYRLGHSEVSDQFLRLEADGSSVEEGELLLREAFFSGHSLFTDYDDLDSLLRGLGGQLHQAIDIQVVNGLRNFLFGQPGSGGFDLVSLNVQRGRDHGLNSYSATRRAMDLRPPRRFSDITSDTSLQTALFNAYGEVENVELWIGGLAEDPLVEQGSQLGELFTAINVKQFDELRKGDRFWYERYLSPRELEMVEGVTLADVIRNNTNIGNELSDSVFYVPTVEDAQ